MIYKNWPENKLSKNMQEKCPICIYIHIYKLQPTELYHCPLTTHKPTGIIDLPSISLFLCGDAAGYLGLESS